MKRLGTTLVVMVVFLALVAAILPPLAMADGRPYLGALAERGEALHATRAAGAGTMHVADIYMWYTRSGRNYRVNTRVTIVDDDGDPVRGARVYVETVCPPGDVTVTRTATTGLDGSATVSFRANGKGIYTSTVTDVIQRAHTYDPGANVETSDSIEILLGP